MRIYATPIRAMGLSGLVTLNFWLLAAWVSGPGSSGSAESIAWDPKLPTVNGDTSGPRPIGFYKETLARPVFFKTRAPYVPPPAPPPEPPKTVAAPPPVDPGILVGGVIIERNLKKAFLFAKSDLQGSWVSEGESFLGWQLQSVESTGVKLQQQNRILELLLYPRNG